MYTLVFTEDAKKDLKEFSKKAPLASGGTRPRSVFGRADFQ